MRNIRKENPNIKYYQIPTKSQLPNPKNWVVLGFGIYRKKGVISDD